MFLSYFSDGSSQLIYFWCCSNRWITNVFAFHSNFGLCWIHHIHFWLSKADAMLSVILFTWNFSSLKFILCSLLVMIYKGDMCKYSPDGGQASIHSGSETVFLKNFGEDVTTVLHLLTSCPSNVSTGEQYIFLEQLYFRTNVPIFLMLTLYLSWFLCQGKTKQTKKKNKTKPKKVHGT